MRVTIGCPGGAPLHGDIEIARHAGVALPLRSKRVTILTSMRTDSVRFVPGIIEGRVADLIALPLRSKRVIQRPDSYREGTETGRRVVQIGKDGGVALPLARNTLT